MFRLKELIISITARCNSRCSMCDIPLAAGQEIPTRKWKEVIRDARRLNAQTVVFSGGEPLLRKDIFELISFVKDNRMAACLTSNGSLIDQPTAWMLAESRVDVVNISIEGPREVHDRLRGKGGLDKALGALENLKKYNIETTLAATVSSYNYRCLKAVIELARQHAVGTVKFQPFSGIFLNDGRKAEEFFLSKTQAQELELELKEVAGLCGDYGINTNPDRYLERVAAYLSREDHPVKRAPCNALSTVCPIDSRGNFFPCWVITAKEKLIGNIEDRGLIELWGSGRHRAILESINKHGCPGCMMSCYDQNFGAQELTSRVAVNLKRLQRLGLPAYLRDSINRWKKRLKFYLSYRGSLPRILHKLKRPGGTGRPAGIADQAKLDGALKDIEAAEKIIEEEIKCVTGR